MRKKSAIMANWEWVLCHLVWTITREVLFTPDGFR